MSDIKTGKDGTFRHFDELGRLHRTDGPAIIQADGSQYWHVDGKKHREGGPAIVLANGSRLWYRDGELHRTDGPAVIWADGSRLWYRDGELHRTDGPAVIWADGSREWRVNGIPHRDDGPNIEWPVSTSPDGIEIGCQEHPREFWEEVTDDELEGMHREAVKFWRTYREVILSLPDGEHTPGNYTKLLKTEGEK